MTRREKDSRSPPHQEPDRVPINYIANPGINARLMKHYGFGTDEVDAFLDALGVDFRSVGPRYVGPRLHPEVPGRNVIRFGAFAASAGSNTKAEATGTTVTSGSSHCNLWRRSLSGRCPHLLIPMNSGRREALERRASMQLWR